MKGGYKINDSSRTILLWTGMIVTFLAAASALFCYLLRGNKMYKRIMGVKTGQILRDMYLVDDDFILNLFLYIHDTYY